MSVRSEARSPFASPLEAGFRALFVLAASQPDGHDLQRLVYYDYLMVHSGDIEGAPASLHPATPHRSGEWIARRQVVEDGLLLMISKELAAKRFDSFGITYAATDLTQPFLAHLQSSYARSLAERAAWVYSHFHAMTDESLRTFMTQHAGEWGAEFKHESLLRAVPDERT